METRPETRYTRHDGAYLAYQVVGSGPLDVVLFETWTHHVELWWESSDVARQLRRIASLGRLILFDRRGTGLSDPVSVESFPDLDAQVSDVCAIMDAAGSERAALLGFYEGGPLAIKLAAREPDRCRSLVLYGTSARLVEAPDYPIGRPEPELVALNETWAEALAAGDPKVVEFMAPSRAGDRAFADMFLRLSRAAVGPGALQQFYRQSYLVDVRDELGKITAPTLVLHRSGDRLIPASHGRYLAEHIPDARYVELAGNDHASFTENADELVDQIAEFLTGSYAGADPDRRVTAILFTDIVGSTSSAAAIGDRDWRAVLDEHDRIARREFARFGGTEIDHTGDGFLVTFDTPRSAIHCAAAMREALTTIGVAIRAGVHIGEVEVRGAAIGGLTVHIGARVCSIADAGQILASSTVREVMAGSELEFAPHGRHTLKGVPNAWHLYEAVLAR
jgi:pimeloyl-ACP methyl ester carboxylesterase